MMDAMDVVQRESNDVENVRYFFERTQNLTFSFSVTVNELRIRELQAGLNANWGRVVC